MKNDIIDVFNACVDGTLDKIDLQFEDNAAVCVVLASEGYPVKYEKGLETKIDGAIANYLASFDDHETLTLKPHFIKVTGEKLNITCRKWDEFPYGYLTPKFTGAVSYSANLNSSGATYGKTGNWNLANSNTNNNGKRILVTEVKDTSGTKYYYAGYTTNYGEIYDTRDDNAYARSCGICMYTSKAINNCINYGTVHFHGGLGYGLFNEIFNYRYNSMSNNQRNYYLETSCSKGYQYGGSTRTCISMTSNEMQKQAFLDELNTNAKAMGSNYSKWKFGKNGYPTLEFVKE